MKATKLILIAAGILGVVACFLPYIKHGPISMSLWENHTMPTRVTSGLLNGPKQVYVVLAGFGLTALMGVLGIKQLLRWQAIVAILGCLLTLACETVRKGFSTYEGMHTAIGGKLLFIAAILGVIGGVLGVAKPEN
ncbi:MAG TPA: hypothetical protein VL326_36380 [Kofleriaceae bacterium]|jgi:hypothetical protein|nr:hypothetical protein [Kofleriaceae bacterium]